ncbi:all-trans-retinol 13,14-reductase [Salmonella enterica subsp. enterica serovar Choleraesuis]|nr:all-trans-retinol 13,14-reductase [Salmonella enterica subsp. enterica serovar Choleraesuis]
MSQQNKTAVVIGAGIAGMTSALLLGMNGYKVSLVETEKQIGQTLRGFYKSRVYFDSGMHFAGELSEHGLLSAYLRYLGVSGLDCLDFDQDCFEKVRFSDNNDFNIPIGYEKVIESLVDAFPAEKQGIVKYMQLLRKAYYVSPYHSLSMDVGTGAERDHPELLVSTTQVIEQHVSNPYLRTLLAVPCLYHGVSPDETPFLRHAWVAGTHLDSVRTFTHGGLSLVEAYEQRLKDLGATFYCGRRAVKLHCRDSGEIKAVELDDGEILSCDTAIYTGHPHYLPELMPEGALRPGARKRLRELQDGMAAHLLYLTNDSTPPDIMNRKNVVYCRHDLPLSQQFNVTNGEKNSPFYICAGPAALRYSAGLSDRGGDYIAIEPCSPDEYLPYYGTGGARRPDGYRALKKKRLAEFSARLFETLPEMEGMRVVGGGSPLTLQRYLHTPHCGLYGVAHDRHQFTPMPNTKIPGFYLAGQGVTAPGILGSLISAFVACGYLFGHSHLLDGVRACK